MAEAFPTVVVVDDSQTIRVFFERTVERLAVELRTFQSAADAMQYLSHERPALLFLDIIMPGKDGFTFLEELRRDPAHQDTPVVVISSKDYAQDRATARDLGVLEYVLKPMSTTTIRELIVRITGAGQREGRTGEDDHASIA